MIVRYTQLPATGNAGDHLHYKDILNGSKIRSSSKVLDPDVYIWFLNSKYLVCI